MMTIRMICNLKENQSIAYTVEGTLVYKQWVTVNGENFYRFKTASVTGSGTYNI